jgi:hypothetical protein
MGLNQSDNSGGVTEDQAIEIRVVAKRVQVVIMLSTQTQIRL